MRTVGAFYLLLCVLIVARVPIRVEGPDGVMDLVSAGDPVDGFLVDTWVTYGIEIGLIGAALLVASRNTGHAARAVVWLVLAIELVRGIGIDMYKLARGYDVLPESVWIVIHTLIITTGLFALRSANRMERAAADQGPASSSASTRTASASLSVP
jgi:ABC-type nickel/cobalt efflux system permease component RcnA